MPAQWKRTTRKGSHMAREVFYTHSDPAHPGKLPGQDGAEWQRLHEHLTGVAEKARRLADDVRLDDQTLCLEEMLGARIESGAILYGKSCRRPEVASTEAAALQLHDLFERHETPKAQYGKKCKSCSLLETCMPKVTGIDKDVQGYLEKALEF